MTPTIVMSPAVQQTAVGEGLALGCIALGRESFNGTKQNIEWAFAQAWRSWPYRSRFPAIRADIHRNDLLGVIDKSPRRHSPRLAGWSGQWPFVAFTDDDEYDAIAEVIAPEAAVPLSGWKDLAQALLAHLDRDSNPPG